MLAPMSASYPFLTQGGGIGVSRRKLSALDKKNTHAKEQHTHKNERY